jgi:hypothetical protein
MTEWEYYGSWNGEKGTAAGDWGWNIAEAADAKWSKVKVMNYLGARG